MAGEITIRSHGANDIVLLNTFVISKKCHRVLFYGGEIVWERENSKKAKTIVPVCDIITIKLTPIRKNRPHQTESAAKSFTLHYGRRRTDTANANQWHHCTQTFSATDARIVKLWHDNVTKVLDQQTHRPRNLLLFINPYGGKRDAQRIYEKCARPLFQLADVDVSVVISQRPNQIRDIIVKQCLDEYSGIVCIGGDGTFSEVFNGLIQKGINDMGMDTTKANNGNIPKPDIPIGIIPGGSTDTVAYCLHGTTDIATAVIHIILGQVSGFDLCSVADSMGLVRMYASVMSYGYLGDIAADSEKFRWMGPKRYDYSGFKKFMSNRGYAGEIAIQLDDDPNGNPNDGQLCSEHCERCANTRRKHEPNAHQNKETESVINNCEDPCDVDPAGILNHIYANNSIKRNSCISSTNNSSDDGCSIANGTVSSYVGGTGGLSLAELGQHNQWRIIKGKFFMVTGANISCACARSPNGFSKYAHIGDGCVDLVVIRHTSFFNNLRLLLKLSSRRGRISDLPFVEIYRTKKFQFRTMATGPQNDGSIDGSITGSTQPIRLDGMMGDDRRQAASQWNCDGEVLHEADVTVRSHCQLIKVYRRGPIKLDNAGDSAAQSGCSCLCGF